MLDIEADFPAGPKGGAAMQSKFTRYAVYTMIFLILLFCGLSATAYAATPAPTVEESGWAVDQTEADPIPATADALLQVSARL